VKGDNKTTTSESAPLAHVDTTMESEVPAPVAEPMDVTMPAESAAPTADSEMPEMVPATAVEAVEPEAATKEAAPCDLVPSEPAPSEPAPAEPASSEAPPAAVITKEAVPSPSSRHPGPVKVVPGTDDGNEADAEGADEEEEESEDDVYEVDSVLEQRPDPNKSGGREFLVKWKGWGHK